MLMRRPVFSCLLLFSLLPLLVAQKCGGKQRWQCPVGECCNSNDRCGDSASDCGAGCQPEYGVCAASPTASPTRSSTSSRTASRTATPSRTGTRAPSKVVVSVSRTPTPSKSKAPSASRTSTTTSTPSSSGSKPPSPSKSSSRSPSPSVTRTRTPTSSRTASTTRTPTRTPTRTATASRSISRTPTTSPLPPSQSPTSSPLSQSATPSISMEATSTAPSVELTPTTSSSVPDIPSESATSSPEVPSDSATSSPEVPSASSLISASTSASGTPLSASNTPTRTPASASKTGAPQSVTPTPSRTATRSRTPTATSTKTRAASVSSTRSAAAVSPAGASASPTKMSIDPGGQCGPSVNRRCDTQAGMCCSQYGWCGRTADFCGVGCQIGYGACDGTSSPSSSSTSPMPASKSSTPGLPVPSTSATPSKGSAPAFQVITECTEPGTVAITFDDGPYLYTASIADAFTAAGGKTTFFVNGNNWGCIYSYVSQLRAVAAAGHQIASHTWSHSDMATLSYSVQYTELTKLDVALQKILGYSPTYFRPPYGSYNANTNNAAAAAGYKYNVMWSMDSGDSAGYTITQQKAVFSNAANNAYHIVLNHDTLASTANTLVSYMINWAQSRNLRMVTVGECMGDPQVNWYKNYGTPGTQDSSWTCY